MPCFRADALPDVTESNSSHYQLIKPQKCSVKKHGRARAYLAPLNILPSLPNGSLGRELFRMEKIHVAIGGVGMQAQFTWR